MTLCTLILLLKVIFLFIIGKNKCACKVRKKSTLLLCSTVVFGMRLCADMDRSLRVVYPTKISKVFVLHSLLRKYELTTTTE